MTAILATHDFTLQSATKRLTFFGALHVFDPAHQSLRRLEALYKESKPDVLLIEGTYSLSPTKDWRSYQKHIEWIRAHSRDGLITEYGEAGAAMALVEPGTAIYCPEPDFALELRYVESLGYSRDSMFLYYHLRIVYQYLQTDRTKNVVEYVEPHIADFANCTKWQGYDYSFSRFSELVEDWFDTSLKDLMHDDKQFDLVSTFSPYTEEPERKETNDVSLKSMQHRDDAIKNWILHFLNMRRSVFVVYGRGHADVMRAPLTEEFVRSFGDLIYQDEREVIHEEIAINRR